jgi:hypothetical protein
MAFNFLAIWINEIGAISERGFNVVKEKPETKTVIIDFGKREVYEIKKAYIRAKKIIVYKKSNGEIIIQDPDAIGRINLEEKGIKVLRFNLQNSALQESKSAIYRWTVPADAIDRLTPIFKLLFICIAVAVIGWAAFKFAGSILQIIANSRLLNCAQLFPSSPIPAAVINSPVAATV